MAKQMWVDLFKRHRNEYVAPKQPRLIQIKPAQYLIFDDIDRDVDHDVNHNAADDAEPGDNRDDGKRIDQPAEPLAQLTARTSALYAVASELRLISIARYQRDFILGKLEWLLDDQDDELLEVPQRHCRILMRVPEFISAADLSAAIAALLIREWPASLRRYIRRARLEMLFEGHCVQQRYTPHHGTYPQAKAAAVLRDFARSEGLAVVGPPHIINLTSARFVPPEHSRGLIRLPVRVQPTTYGAPTTSAHDASQLMQLRDALYKDGA